MWSSGITSGISTRPRREVPDVIARNEMVSICPTLIIGCNNEILHKSNNGQTDVGGIEPMVVMSKRKDISPILSPRNDGVEDRATKIQRGNPGDQGSSPVLKIRRGFNIKSRSPPAGGALKSPALGRVGKLKRRLSTPKRSYTPDQKQVLITSMFSPRVLPTTNSSTDENK